MAKKELKLRAVVAPTETVIVSAYDPDGKADACTLAFYMVSSHVPPCVTVGINATQKRKTLKDMLETKAFVLGFPGAHQVREADYLGVESGYKTDKLKNIGFTTSPAQTVHAPIINELPLSLECEMKNSGELPMFYAEDTHPAIIDADTFQKAQEEFAARYGVEIRHGTAERASYMCHSGDYDPPDFHFRRPVWTEEQRREHAQVYKSRETCRRVRAHDLSLFIKCEGCGETLSAKTAKFTDGTKDVRWTCHWHNRVAPETPKPMEMRDRTLKKIICGVLGTENFSEEAMTERLTHISALGDRLTFHFKDGHTEQRTYAHEKRKRCPRRKS